MDWCDCINGLLRSIERRLTDGADIAQLAREAHYAPGHLQRMFSITTGITLGEYIRQRRLSAAGQELRASGARVIDVALRYGYDTPESFQKAFRRFHGVSPSAARDEQTRLRYLNPLQIKLQLTGGTIMDYQLEKIDRLMLMGKSWRTRYDNSFEVVPGYWCEYYAAKPPVEGYVGMCLDDDETGETFLYVIGCFCSEEDEAPEGYEKYPLDGHLWAKFRAVGPTPGSIQRVNRQVYTEWLPNNPEYSLAVGCNLEVYSEGDMASEDYVCELWLPVERK